jgi:superfamily I DNA/RNA helicase
MEASWWTRPDQLDDEQKDVVSLALQGSHLVIGPPGSGKTNLLLLRAAYLQAKGRRNYQILTFGRVLKEFLVNGTDTTNVDVDRIKTYRAWAGEILRENGVELSNDTDFEIIRSEMFDGLSGLPDDIVDEYKLDCVLLDEAQDYTSKEVELIMKFSDNIFAVGDRNQQIYRTNGVLDRLGRHCDTTTNLTAHYRNGRRICRVADGIRNLVGDQRGLEAWSQYDEAAVPSEVIFHPSEPLRQQVDRAMPVIADQLRAYPNAIIGVLCPLRRDVAAAWDMLSRSYLADQIQLQMFETGYAPLDPDRRVLVGTIHGAKGLEFRTLHLLGTNGIQKFPKNRQRIAYTAVTRAKTSLAIYHEGALIGSFEKGLAALNEAPAEVALDDLFKR